MAYKYRTSKPQIVVLWCNLGDGDMTLMDLLWKRQQMFSWWTRQSRRELIPLTTHQTQSPTFCSCCRVQEDPPEDWLDHQSDAEATKQCNLYSSYWETRDWRSLRCLTYRNNTVNLWKKGSRWTKNIFKRSRFLSLWMNLYIYNKIRRLIFMLQHPHNLWTSAVVSYTVHIRVFIPGVSSSSMSKASWRWKYLFQHLIVRRFIFKVQYIHSFFFWLTRHRRSDTVNQINRQRRDEEGTRLAFEVGSYSGIVGDQ